MPIAPPGLERVNWQYTEIALSRRSSNDDHKAYSGAIKQMKRGQSDFRTEVLSSLSVIVVEDLPDKFGDKMIRLGRQIRTPLLGGNTSFEFLRGDQRDAS